MLNIPNQLASSNKAYIEYKDYFMVMTKNHFLLENTIILLPFWDVCYVLVSTLVDY